MALQNGYGWKMCLITYNCLETDFDFDIFIGSTQVQYFETRSLQFLWLALESINA